MRKVITIKLSVDQQITIVLAAIYSLLFILGIGANVFAFITQNADVYIASFIWMGFTGMRTIWVVSQWPKIMVSSSTQ